MMTLGDDCLTQGPYLPMHIMDARVKPGHDAEYFALT